MTKFLFFSKGFFVFVRSTSTNLGSLFFFSLIKRLLLVIYHIFCVSLDLAGRCCVWSIFIELWKILISFFIFDPKISFGFGFIIQLILDGNLARNLVYLGLLLNFRRKKPRKTTINYWLWWYFMLCCILLEQRKKTVSLNNLLF